MEKKYDVSIIGGGISGLLLGGLLSKRGKRVLVCEKNSFLGGRYRSFVKDGFLIEDGFKANRFSHQGYVQELFNLLEEPIEFISSKEIVIYEKDRFSVLPRGLFPILKDKNLTLKDKWGFLKLYRELLALNAKDYYNLTISDWLTEKAAVPDIINLFSYYSQLGMVSPNLQITSMGEFISMAQRGLTAKYPFGIPRGGWIKKIDLLSSLIKKNGEIRLNSPVAEIVVKDREAKGIRIGEEVILSDYVIAAFPLNQGLFNLAEKDYFPAEFVSFIEKIKPTSGINIDFFLSKKISSEARLIATHPPYPYTQGILVSNFIPETAPPGKLYGSWLSLLPSERMGDSEFVDNEIKILKELLSQIFPSIWNYCEWERVMRLKVVNSVAPLPFQTSEKRADFVAPGISNLFFVGDTTRGEGGGGDVAMSSVLKCYHKILPMM